MSVKGFKLSDGTVVKYDYSSLDNIITDSTLSVDGVAADAGAVGDELLSLQNKSFELADIRVGDDGVTYSSAGDAVRGQIGDLKQDLLQVYVEGKTLVINGGIPNGEDVSY